MNVSSSIVLQVVVQTLLLKFNIFVYPTVSFYKCVLFSFAILLPNAWCRYPK